jgi:hypothetical protein
VGHSHGCSQIIQAVNSLTSQSQIPSARIKGIILMGGALSDGPSEMAKDGGHWIFKFVPMFMLKRMQPSLSESFFQAAVHPSNQERMRAKSMDVSNRNDMSFCKAFYIIGVIQNPWGFISLDKPNCYFFHPCTVNVFIHYY